MPTNLRYLDAIKDHVLIYDGAMGTNIQRYNLTAEDFGGEALNGCNDYLVITRPDVIGEIHSSFMAVGSEVVETCTFRSNRLTLAEYGLQDRVLEINRAAARLARGIADRFEAETGKPRFVAGSIGPTGKLPSSDDPDLSNVTFDQLAAVFYEQAQGLVEGGADVLLIETSQDILEVRAAVYGINQYFKESGNRVALQVQVTLDTSGRMLLGTDIAAALTILESLALDVIGLNCSTGPEHMREPIRYLTEYSTKPISVLPNAGLPINVDGEAVYPLEPEPFAHMMAEFVEWGVSVVGGCCGTRPEHLAKVIEKVGANHPPKHSASEGEPRAASGMRSLPMVQNPAPTMIGERVNSQGSRKVKRLLLADDYEGILQIAQEQVDSGAHILDICVALTERGDEAAQMRTLVKKLAMSIEAPLMIDITDPEVAEAALAVYPGRGIINGNNLENGRERIDKVLPIAKKHGAAVLSMTIDEIGMAKTAARKLEVARAIYDIAVGEYGMKAGDLIFDDLTFTLATGDAEFVDSAKETLEGIRLIKQELPGVLTSLGVSNLSFGLGEGARGVLNSVFLYHAVQYGLDMAIVNPAHIKPYAEIPEEQRELANDLIFNRHPDALPRFIAYFDVNVVTNDSTEQEDPTEGMTPEQKLHWQIVHRKKEGVEALVDACLQNQNAVAVLNNVLLPAMKEVGDKFGAGELILPFVLQSAETMKKTVAYLENFLEKKEGTTKGTVVLATVYGDVHDIGKNLVKTILSNNGYTVHDLGKQVPANVIIEAAQTHNADAIGLSALLVSTSKQMPLIVNELARRGLTYPVLIGGAAINRRFGRRILFLDEGGAPYAPGVFYCKDAFEGLDTMEQLVNPDSRTTLLERIVTEANTEMDKVQPQRPASSGRKALLAPAPHVPTPPFWGAKSILKMPTEIVLQYLHKPELFRLNWGAKNTHGAEWEKISADFEARLAKMSRQAMFEHLLEPRAVYGYFPANSLGDDLLIYDPQRYTADGSKVEIARFAFPRQDAGEFLCISDYYRSVESGVTDVVALQIVTVGEVATRHFDTLQNANEYTEAYFFHGLAVQAAEATAQYVNLHIRRELGLDPKQGKRYSWGYPACPNLADHAVVLKLLPEAETTLGMTLTSAYQWIPEQSTAAIFAHHPEAKYYAVSGGRLEQLTEA
ncbi:MAG TPA: methionine synthase [Aggregatilineales bacterium]|nr:methionine synthase [Anaerolineales bacterium]HRE47057.1 methionine synthase [Aggregatilineales bacterium]